MIYPKFKVGDLVRKNSGQEEVLPWVLFEQDISAPNIGTYYRIYYFEEQEEIWGHPRDWDLVPNECR